MNQPAREHFPRVLGLWDATSVVIGAIVGVGIFFAPSDVARVNAAAGVGGAMLAWTIGGLIALLGAFTFAELGRLRPVAGSQYHVLREVYGRLPAFLFVFCNLTAVQAGAVAIIAILCAQNLGVTLYGTDPAGAWVVAVAIALTLVIVVANAVGVKSGARLQNITVVVKLLALAAIVVLALAFEPSAARTVANDEAAGAALPGAPDLPFFHLFAAVTITLFAYGGGQQVLWMAGEVADAERVVPRAIVFGVGIVIATYLAANWAYFDLLGFGGVRDSKTLAADAFSAVWPGWGRRLAAAAVAISAFGVLNAQLLTGPRLTWAMAHDGLFFSPFARLHPRFATPLPAILLLGALAIALVAGLGLERTDVLITGVVVVDAVFFVLTGFALPVLRARAPAAARGPAWIALGAIVFSALQLLAITGSLMVRDVRIVALTGLAWIAVAAVVWVVFFRGVRVRSAHAVVVLGLVAAALLGASGCSAPPERTGSSSRDSLPAAVPMSGADSARGGAVGYWLAAQAYLDGWQTSGARIDSASGVVDTTRDADVASAFVLGKAVEQHLFEAFEVAAARDPHPTLDARIRALHAQRGKTLEHVHEYLADGTADALELVNESYAAERAIAIPLAEEVRAGAGRVTP